MDNFFLENYVIEGEAKDKFHNELILDSLLVEFEQINCLSLKLAKTKQWIFNLHIDVPEDSIIRKYLIYVFINKCIVILSLHC